MSTNRRGNLIQTDSSDSDSDYSSDTKSNQRNKKVLNDKKKNRIDSDSMTGNEGKQSPAKRKESTIKKKIRSPKRMKTKNNDHKVEEDEDMDENEYKGLTQLEKEQKMLEKFEKEEQEKKLVEYKRQYDEEQQQTIPSRQLNASEKRKEALKHLKKVKNEKQSQLDDDDEEGELEDEEYRSHRREHTDEEDYEERQDHYDNEDDDFLARKRHELRMKRKALIARPEIRTEEPLTTTQEAEVDEEEEQKKLEEKEKRSRVATYEEFTNCLYKMRPFFEKHYFEPYFDTLVKGVYIKIPVQDKEGKMVYQLVEVVSTTEMTETPYTFCGEKTTKGLAIISNRKHENIKFECISSRPVEVVEYDQFCLCRKNPITYGKAVDISERIKKLTEHYSYSNSEINTMTDRMKASGRVKFRYGMEKTRLERDIKAAEYSQDYERLVILRERLNKMESEHKKITENEESEEARTIMKINERNRLENIRRDAEASEERRKESEKITIEQKLRYQRTNPAIDGNMYLTQKTIDKMVQENKLVAVPGVEDTYKTVTSSNYVIKVLKDLDKTEDANDKPTEEVKVDDNKEKEEEVIFYDQQGNQVERPKKFEDTADLHMRVKDCDGGYTYFRAINVILREKKEEEERLKEERKKRKRTGMSPEEYLRKLRQKKA